MIPGKKYRPEDFIGIAWRYKWLILLPFMVAAAGTAAYTARLPNLYQSETAIMVVPPRLQAGVVQAASSPVQDRLQSITQQVRAVPASNAWSSTSTCTPAGAGPASWKTW